MATSIGLVSLGCDKNRINAEQMLWRLMDAGYDIVEVPEMATVVIVNTCAFIESAKSEAIENILEIVASKRDNRVDDIGGNVEKIIVTGCLSQRYGEEIMREFPEVDGLVGCGSFDDIVSVVDDVLDGKRPCLFGDIDEEPEETARFLTGPQHYAYIKVAEGCDHRCSYCVIPSLRGPYRSREMEYILAEARDLVENGIKELIIVAQDVTRYGTDLYDRHALPELLNKLCEIDGLKWIRLHYLYPEEISDELIQTIKENKKILRYLDIPIQHIDDGILKSMNRRSNSAGIKTLITKLRKELEGVVIRTSIICGYPGEGDDEFNSLCAFLREYKLERAGFFAFSPEEGTPAAEMDNIPDSDVVQLRMEVLQNIQDDVMEGFNKNSINKVVEVIVDGYDTVIELYYGRTYADSPDIDGRVFFGCQKKLSTGDFVDVLIDDVIDGDLLGTAIK